jgi:hypothetical protein
MNQQLATTIPPNYPSFFSFFSMISPFVVIVMLVFISIINSNLKGIIYLAGVLFLFFIVMLFQQTVRYAGLTHTPDPTCQLFHFPVPLFSIPSFNSALFIYTLIYLLIPMLSSGIMNFPLVVILLILYTIDCVVKKSNNCTTPIGIILGSVVGLMWGSMWYVIIQANDPSLLYYDDLVSNKVACSRPTEQKFKCSVYKNGELLKSL